MKVGATFRFADSSEDGGHLWVIVSDPALDPDHVLVTSVTTLHERVFDRSCVIEAREHPQIRRASCMYYDETSETTANRLAQMEKAGEVVVHPPFSRALMERVWRGAAISPLLKYEYLALLDGQGLTPAPE